MYNPFSKRLTRTTKILHITRVNLSFSTIAYLQIITFKYYLEILQKKKLVYNLNFTIEVVVNLNYSLKKESILYWIVYFSILFRLCNYLQVKMTF